MKQENAGCDSGLVVFICKTSDSLLEIGETCERRVLWGLGWGFAEWLQLRPPDIGSWKRIEMLSEPVLKQRLIDANCDFTVQDIDFDDLGP